MPFKDKQKLKEYQEINKDTKRHYDKNYKEINREAWNLYQRSYKVEKRIREVEQIKTEVLEMDISEPGRLAFKAAVILLFISKTGYTKERWISYRTSYSIEDVKTIFKNWIDNGIYKDGSFYFEDESFVTFVLTCMCGAGEIIRYTKV